MNKFLTWCRLSMAVSIGTTVVCTTVALCWGRSEPPAVAPDYDPADEELESLLDELARAWKPRDRKLLFDRAQNSATRLDLALMQVLWQPRHPRIRDALFLAEALGDPALAKPATALAFAGPPTIRPVAVVVADGLIPFTGRDLQRLLRHPDEAIVLALLQAFAKRKELPVAPLLSLVAHESQSVQEKANELLAKETLGVRRMAVDPETDPESRALALRHLEITRSIGKCERDEVAKLPTMWRYLVARCMVAAGDRSGFDLLLGILQRGEAGLTDFDDAAKKALLAEIRGALALLADTTPDAGLEHWRIWFDSGQPLRQVVLPAAAVAGPQG